MLLPDWIWQHPNWPSFTWQAETLAPLLRACAKAQGQLLGLAGTFDSDSSNQEALDALLQNILTTSAIEGETLNVSSVRSSLARRLGLDDTGVVDLRSESMAELMLEATRQPDLQLTMEKGSEDGINASQYQAEAKVSKATATRHLSDLLEKGCLLRLPGGGRSTRYRLAPA